jgi:hypothetical protein
MTERWITVDPGEDCGLSVWEDDRLILGWTLKMDVVDIMLHFALLAPGQVGSKAAIAQFLDAYPECAEFYQEIAAPGYKIIRIVCEDWRLYPWVMYTPDGRASHALDFDQCRTARLIGAITHVARLAGIPVHLQGADIKETAVAAGAEQLYYKPLHENRHQNDAIQHGVYWLVIEETRAPKDARI